MSGTEAQVVAVATSGGRVYSLAASRNPSANQSWLLVSKIGGKETNRFTLPYANPRGLSVAPDGSLLYLSTDNVARKQYVVRVTDKGTAVSIAETPKHSVNVWQVAEDVEIQVVSGETLRMAKNGGFTIVATPPVQARAASVSSCGVCQTGTILLQSSAKRAVSIDRSNGEMQVRSGTVWSKVVFSHPWIAEGVSDYEMQRTRIDAAALQSGRMATPTVVVAGGMSADGDLYLLVGPHDTRRGYRVIRVSSDGTQTKAITCATDNTPNGFNPVFITPAERGTFILADLLGHFRAYEVSADLEVSQ